MRNDAIRLTFPVTPNKRLDVVSLKLAPVGCQLRVLEETLYFMLGKSH